MTIKFNMLQQPKQPGYLACFKARPGHKLVQRDLSSIEPRIIAEFSQDPMLMKLYGPGAKPNDVYLFNGAHIELFAAEILNYYNPDDPTKEMISHAKAKLKKTRAFCKEITLAAGYGASAERLRMSLITKGFPITKGEAKIIHRDYWRLYSGIRKFQAVLEDMWTHNDGWFPNVSGRPICVAAEYKHDATNRFAQSSGHDVLMMDIYHTNRLRKERGIPMKPWLVDFYDEQIWEVPEAAVEDAVQAMKDALVVVNDELGMGVKIEGDPEVVDNLAQIKCPEEYKEWLQNRF